MAILAISRGTASGAEALAHMVATQLGYPYLNREQAVVAAAKQYRIPLEELTAAMERRPSFWGRALSPHVAFLPAMRATLCASIQQENLVYCGYAGHLLLPRIPLVVTVRAVAEREVRTHAAQKRKPLSHAQALAELDAEDRTRREWAHFLFGVDWQDPTLYDLVVNLSRVDLETAGAMVLRLAESPQYQPTPASRQALADFALFSRVTAILAMDFRTRDARLKVTVDKGVVTITGTTRWAEVAEAVPAVVQQVKGVTAVKSEITGGIPPPGLTWY
ncbi:MAG TPA: cytidylate kinase family protein [Candidatus Baltobacteraceae bacterium]|nr:cytidylate kinase family protein [Candidatus Baltobacteraceae bacterium]